jgi:hypothetical protein
MKALYRRRRDRAAAFEWNLLTSWQWKSPIRLKRLVLATGRSQRDVGASRKVLYYHRWYSASALTLAKELIGALGADVQPAETIQYLPACAVPSPF